MFEDTIGHIQSAISPPQGMTSTVTLVTSDRGRFVVKRSDRPPFADWLKREAHVLKVLETTNLPVPRCIAFDEQPDSATVLMTALPGEPLNEALRRGVGEDVRRDLLKQFGRMLRTVHGATVPMALQAGQPWLERILNRARLNVEHGYAEPDAPPVEQMVVSRPAPVPEVLIHGDYTIDNVLVDAGRIIGVIDWSGGDVGDPRYDLALATRPQKPESAFLDEGDFAAFYAGYAGKRLMNNENQWFSNLYEYF